MSRLKTIIDANIKENGNQEITGKTMNYVLTEIADEVKREGYFPDMSVGFADNLVGRGESVPAEFSFRASGGKSIKDGAARIKRIKGNSVVWNQKIKGFDSWNLQGGTIEGNEVVWSASDRTGALNAFSNTFAQHANHKYLISADVKASSTNVGLGLYFTNSPLVRHTGRGNYESLAIITNGKGDGIDACYLTDTSTSGYGEIRAKNYRCIDLTQMFQAGNEPTTIEEYNARKPIVADEYAYNEGEVIHCNIESIKSVGDNAWDEQWEVGGLSEVTGQEYDTTTNFRSKNYIKILPNTQYYFKKPAGVFLLPYYYDEDKNFIAADDVLFTSQNGNAFTTLNAAYMRFIVNQGNYGNDIMLTLVHSGWKQDTDAGYHPYWQDTLPLPIIRKYFPDGMKSAGSAHDEIRYNKASGKWEKVVRIVEMDMGSLDWFDDTFNGVPTFTSKSITNGVLHQYDTIGGALIAKYSQMPTFAHLTSSDDKVFVFNSAAHAPNTLAVRDTAYTDAASFKAAMQGVILYYELAEPVIREIDEPIGTDYRVADFGTEQAISSIPSAPFSADIIYQFNAVDMIRELWLKVQELESRVAQL